MSGKLERSDNKSEKKRENNDSYVVGKKTEIAYKVSLSSEMAEALGKYEERRNSVFRICDIESFSEGIIDSSSFGKLQSPSAVFGDFNGDGMVDSVLMGYMENGQGEVIAIVSQLAKRDKDKAKEIQDVVMSPSPGWTDTPNNSKKEEIKEKYKAFEIALLNGWAFRGEKPYRLDLALTLHRKGEIIKSSNPNRCSHVLTTDAFGIENFDEKNTETLFPCGEMPLSVACLMDK